MHTLASRTLRSVDALQVGAVTFIDTWGSR